jgi:hypothetical protein
MPTDPLWEPPTGRSPCPGKHAWVYYHSYKVRECCDCGRRENLWADFGLARQEKNDGTA